MKHFVKKSGFLSVLLALCLLLAACSSHEGNPSKLDVSETPSEDNSTFAETSLTESELLEWYTQQLTAMLDECRPEEAYQFPDFSGEITDVRITVRERNVDMSLWSHSTDDKAYDIFYGYLADEVWYDYPSANYHLKALDSFYLNGWEATAVPHIVEIGDYLLFAFCEANEDKTMSLYDSLGSTCITVSDYFKRASDKCKNWHYKENMHAYGTDAFDLEMTEFGKWYFIIIEKESLAEDYTLTFDADWLVDFPEIKTTYTYNDIIETLNR